VAATGLVAVAGTLINAETAGATLPGKASMYKMRTTTAVAGAFQAGWNAAEVSLGFTSSVTHCTGNGTFSELIGDIKKDISHHREVTAEFAAYGHNCSTGGAIPYTSWVQKAKDIITSVEKITSWGRYWGGIVLDEEGGFYYNVLSAVNINEKTASYLVNHGGSELGTTWLFDQIYASSGTSWDHEAYYEGFMKNPELRPAPQLYNAHMSSLVESACRHSTAAYHAACRVIPTLYENSNVPAMSTSMGGKTIHSWGSKDWYIRFQ